MCEANFLEWVKVLSTPTLTIILILVGSHRIREQVRWSSRANWLETFRINATYLVKKHYELFLSTGPHLTEEEYWNYQEKYTELIHQIDYIVYLLNPNINSHEELKARCASLKDLIRTYSGEDLKQALSNETLLVSVMDQCEKVIQEEQNHIFKESTFGDYLKEFFTKSKN